VNVVRFVPSIAGFVYATRDDSLYVNLFAAGHGTARLGDVDVGLSQATDYPWEGRVTIAVAPARPAEFAVRVRIPGWAQGRPVPGDLYRYLDDSPVAWTLLVNGEAIDAPLEDGYAVVRRTWNAGDTVELDLPMPVRRVLAHNRVEADRGRVALERGPVVYCFEAVDHGGRVANLALPDIGQFGAQHRPELLGGVTVLTGEGLARVRRDERDLVELVTLTAVPYYAWAHRELGEMAVWLPRQVESIVPPPAPTLASRSTPSASHCWANDSVEALNDQAEPARSDDHSIPRFTWWDHRGTLEWVQLDLPQPTQVTGVEVYWFDDTGIGQCRVPASWRVLYRDGEAWREVSAAESGGVAADAFNALSFAPVTTDALRLEVTLQQGYSGGILEWRVR
jgi:hypothetical protein